VRERKERKRDKYRNFDRIIVNQIERKREAERLTGER
jgi:hypothetical protein